VVNASKFADRCYIGMTDKEGQLFERFPPCIGGGTITIEHEDYLGTVDLIGDVIEGESFEESYALYRLVEKEIEINKYFVKPPVVQGTNMVDDDPGIVADENNDVVQCNIKSERAPLQEYENVLVRLKRLTNDSSIMSVQPFALYNPTKKTVLKLAPGKYHVDLLLVRNERYKGEMTILKNSEYRYIEGSIASDSKTIYYPEEDVEIPTTFSGGAEFDWELKPEDLYSSGKLRFNIIDEGAPKFIEHIGRPIDDRGSCVSLNWNLFEPK